jgi:ABC-type nitrate/sulfonate/bicarbonate transport system substrate-binding protein
MKRRGVIAAGLGAASLAAMRAPVAHAAAPMPIRFGYRPTVAIDLAFVRAASLGEFAAAGFDVTLVPFARSDQIGAALMTGELDGSTGVPLEPFVTLAAKGAIPARAFWVWYFDPKIAYDGFLVPAASRAQSIADLQTARISSYPSAQVSYLLKKMLPHAAITPYDTAHPLGAFEGGMADAVFSIEPTLSQAVASGECRLIEPSAIARHVFGGERVPAAVSLVRAQWLDENPAEANRFLSMVRRIHTENRKADSRDWKTALLTNPKFGGFSESVAARVVEPASSPAEAVTAAQFARFQDLLRDIGALDKPVDFRKLVYTPR